MLSYEQSLLTGMQHAHQFYNLVTVTENIKLQE